MCWAIPGKVVKIKGLNAIVDIGGIHQEVISTLDVKPGDYVMVHAGIIIEKIKEEEAKKLVDSLIELYIESATEIGLTRDEAEKEIRKKMNSIFEK